MDRFMLTEAFNLAEDVEEFNLSASGLNELDSFLDMAGDTSMMDDDTMIIDLEAQAEDELKQSYVGKAIINCNICHSNIFINKDEITINEEEEVNVDLECPYCHSLGDGYTIIGEVKPFEEEAEDEVDEIDIEAEVEPENETEVEEAEVEVEETDEDEENLDEALKADRVAELGKADELNGKLGLGRELEASDEIRGPHYTELNESCKEDELEEDVFSEIGSAAGEAIGGSVAGPVGAAVGSALGSAAGAQYSDILSKGGLVGMALNDSLEEDIEAVSITTDEETMTMETKEDGGVVVETEPVVEEVPEEEMVAPLDDEAIEEIEVAAEINAEENADAEEVADEEIPEEEIIDEIDEESFDGLGESYLKRCYDNVDSFKTTSASINEGILTIEGTIGFTSGNEKNTTFIFEGLNTNSKQRLAGCNEQISRGKKSFKLGCSVENGKVVCESLNYNYKTRNENDESVRVYGTVRKAK